MTTRVGQFPAATSIATTDYIPVEQGGVLKRATPNLLPFAPSGTGAILTRAVQDALRAIVRTGDFSTVGNFNTAQAALTETIGVKSLRIGTGDGVSGVTFPTQGNSNFQVLTAGGTFNGTFDPAIYFVYNYGRANTSDATLTFALEGDYNDGVNRWMELNLDFGSSDGLISKRYLAFQVQRTTGAASWAMIGGTIRLESVVNNAELTFSPSLGKLARSLNDGTGTTAAASAVSLFLANTNASAGTIVSPCIEFDVGSGGGTARLFTSRISGTTGGVFHIATDDSAGTITDGWTVDQSQHLIGMRTGQEILLGTSTALGVGGYGDVRVNGTSGSLYDLMVNGTREGSLLADANGITVANVNARPVLLVTGGSLTQVSILHTASASRNITLTGSNGANPTIGTSAGNLGWSAAFVSNANLRISHGTSALATNAAEGFFHLQSCAGAPSGTPASIPTGQIPMVWDSTNLQLYMYTGGAWKKSAVFT